LRDRGYRIVCTPFARLCHHEAATKAGVFPHEVAAFRARGGERLARDPYYNPNLSDQSPDCRVAGG
jgi:hypothetical protein